MKPISSACNTAGIIVVCRAYREIDVVEDHVREGVAEEIRVVALGKKFQQNNTSRHRRRRAGGEGY